MFSRLKSLNCMSLKPNKLAPVEILIPFATARDTLIEEKLPGP